MCTRLADGVGQPFTAASSVERRRTLPPYSARGEYSWVHRGGGTVNVGRSTHKVVGGVGAGDAIFAERNRETPLR